MTGPQRSPLVPQIPTMAELGLGEATIKGWFGLLGPCGLPPRVVVALNAATNETLRGAVVSERAAGLGARVLGGPPEALAGTIRTERERWGRVIWEANIRPE